MLTGTCMKLCREFRKNMLLIKTVGSTAI